MVGKNPTAVVTIINSGRRPAKVTTAEAAGQHFAIFPKVPTYQQKDAAPGFSFLDFKSVSIMVPNQGTTMTVRIPPVTAPLMAVYESKSLTYYIYAQVVYEDVLSHRAHWTHLCWEYYPGLKDANGDGSNAFVNCPTYNEVDPEHP